MLTSKELKSEQLAYAAALGGFLELREVDETYNGYNRSILMAYNNEHGTIYLGHFNYYGAQRMKIIEGSWSIYKEYEGYVYNFGCDFCVPSKDKKLEEYIRLWNEKADTKYLDKAQKRIEELGGITFIWK